MRDPQTCAELLVRVQRELFQYLIDPEHRPRTNRTLLEDRPTLRDFARVPAAIEWVSPDPKTGKQLKDSA